MECSQPGGRQVSTYRWGGEARPGHIPRARWPASALQVLLAIALFSIERFALAGGSLVRQGGGLYLAASRPAIEQEPGQRSASSLGEPSQRRRLTAEPIKPLPTTQKCVFILATGRSGSSCLADALNQLPTYFIRGEQSASFYHLFNSYRRLNATWQHAFLMKDRLQNQASTGADGSASSAQNQSTGSSNVLHRPSYEYVKDSYNNMARSGKLPWFNDLHPDRVREAVRSMYTMLYGYHGHGVVSGFKEVRYGYYGKGLALRCSDHPDGREVVYGEFEDFMRFLRSMCVDVKLLLNSRASPKAEHNVALKKMTARLKSDAAFEHALNRTHNWYDRYAAEHPEHAFRVVMEDMFNPQTQDSLAESLLTFLGENPRAHRIKFDRMPAWSNMPLQQYSEADEGRDGGAANTNSDRRKMSQRM